MDGCRTDGMAFGNKQIPGIRGEGGARWTAAPARHATQHEVQALVVGAASKCSRTFYRNGSRDDDDGSLTFWLAG